VVTMAALRGHFEKLGFEQVETFINSGNVIFTTSAKNDAALERTHAQANRIEILECALRARVEAERHVSRPKHHRPAGRVVFSPLVCGAWLPLVQPTQGVAPKLRSLTARRR